MKKILIGIIVIAGVVGLGYVALNMIKNNTKKHSPEAIASYDNSGIEINASYCQPSKKGRVIFGNLVPYDIVWRTGANEATVFTTNTNLQFEEGVLKAGNYSLFSIPKENGDWTVIFNGETGQWGTQYAEGKDVLRVKASQETLEKPIEVFNIDIVALDSTMHLLLQWDRTRVKLPLVPVQ